MDSANPYSAPQAQLLSEAVAPTGGGPVPSEIVRDLAGAQRSLVICAAVGFVVTAPVLLGSLVMLVNGGIMGALVVFTLLYMAGAAQLVRTALAIRGLVRSASAAGLAGVTERLATFWRLTSIVTALVVALTMFGSMLMRMFLSAA